MESTLLNLTYEFKIEPGEKLVLPPALVNSLPPGRWVLTVRPAGVAEPESQVRNHASFLNSYAPEDEGLYDDTPAR